METRCEEWNYKAKNNLSLHCNLQLLEMITDGSSFWNNTSHLLTSISTELSYSCNQSQRTGGITKENSLALGVKVIFTVLLILILLGGFLGNTIVCIIVYQKPPMRSAINLLLANMALANILLVGLCIPFALITLWLDEWVFHEPLCNVQAFFHQTLVSEAVCVLLTISIDRYLIIVMRRDKLTPFKAKLIIIVSWIISILIGIPPVFGWGNYGFYSHWLQCILTSQRNAMDMAYVITSSLIIFFLPMSLLSYTYFSIIETVRKRSHQVQARNCLDNIPVGQVNQLGLYVISHPPNMGVDMRFKTRTFKTILILFVVYVICWLPYSAAMLHWNLWKLHHSMPLPGNLLLVFGYMNSAINPCVYCWRIKKFREACQDLLPGPFGICPKLPKKTKRRIDPSGPYKVDPCLSPT